MKHLSKRLLALLLCLVLCFSLLPVTVLAEEEQPAEVTLEETLPAEEPTEEPAEEPAEEPSEEPVEESLEPVPEDAPALLTPEPDADLLTAEHFPDKNLLAALKEEFPNGLTLAQAEEVEELSLYGRGISDATGLGYFSSLEILTITDNNLTSLDLTGFPKLRILLCSNNRLTELDVSSNVNLEYMYCDNNAITWIDLSGCTELEWFVCSKNSLYTLNLSACTALEHLECDYNRIRYLDVRNNPELLLLCCSNNDLKALLLCEDNHYNYLDCSENQLSFISYIEDCTIDYFYCSGNLLSSLSMDTWDFYPRELDCSRNSLLSLPQGYLNTVAADARTLIMDSQSAPATLDAIYCTASLDPDDAVDTLLVDTVALKETQQSFDFLLRWTETDPELLINGSPSGKPIYFKDVIHGYDDEEYIRYFLIPATAVQDGSFYLQQSEDGPVVEIPLNILPTETKADAEYIMLSAGSTAHVPYTLPFADLVTYAEDNGGISISARFVSDKQAPTHSAVSVMVEDDGLTLSATPGVEDQSGYVVVMAMVYDGPVPAFCLSSPIRVDVTSGSLLDEEGQNDFVKEVTLVTTKVTDEFFKTDHAEITVIPQLDMNARIQSPTIEDNIGIHSAKFSNNDLNDLYDLTVVDDRTLVLTPNSGTGQAVLYNGLKIAGTYKSTLLVTIIDGDVEKEFKTAAEITVTVKTSQPKLKAATVKLNSYLPSRPDMSGLCIDFTLGEAPVITGGTVKGFLYSEEYDFPSFATFGVDGWGMDDFYTYTSDNKITPKATKLYYIGEAGAKCSGSLNARVSLEGWTDDYLGWPVTIKVSAAPVAPTLKLSAKSITVYPGVFNNYSKIKLTPSAAYADLPISIARMTQTYQKQTYTFSGFYYGGHSHVETDNMNADIMQENGETYLYVTSYCEDDCTAKLYLELAGKEFPVSIKVKGYAKNMPSAAVKATGTIDTMLPYSKLDLKATLKNVISEQSDAGLYVTKIYSEKKGTDPIVYYTRGGEKKYFDVTDGKDLTASIRMLDPAKLDPTRTYYAETAVSFNDYFDEDWSVIPARVKLSVKASKTTPKPTVKVKTSGAIDLTAGTGLTANFTIKNCFGVGILDFAVYRTYNAQTKKAENEYMGGAGILLMDGVPQQNLGFGGPFKFGLVGNGVELTPEFLYYSVIGDNGKDVGTRLTAGDKYRIEVSAGYDTESGAVYGTTSFTTTLKQSNNVIKLGPPTVTISRKDINDLVTIPITNSGLPIYAMSEMDVTLDAKSAKYFNVKVCTNETLTISWKDQATQASKLPSSVTAKVTFFLRDPETGTKLIYSPQTVTLKINIK